MITFYRFKRFNAIGELINAVGSHLLKIKIERIDNPGDETFYAIRMETTFLTAGYLQEIAPID